eukprot:17770-Chlamydomonas_euryale.AAC.3
MKPDPDEKCYHTCCANSWLWNPPEIHHKLYIEEPVGQAAKCVCACACIVCCACMRACMRACGIPARRLRMSTR